MLLDELKENQTGYIASLNIEGSFAKRLRDMGFCEGEEIKCIRRSALNSPVLYEIKGSRIALRRDINRKIEVIS